MSSCRSSRKPHDPPPRRDEIWKHPLRNEYFTPLRCVTYSSLRSCFQISWIPQSMLDQQSTLFYSSLNSSPPSLILAAQWPNFGGALTALRLKLLFLAISCTPLPDLLAGIGRDYLFAQINFQNPEKGLSSGGIFGERRGELFFFHREWQGTMVCDDP